MLWVSTLIGIQPRQVIVMGNKHITSLPPQVADDLEETTAFSYAEINDLYRQFRHDCPDLQMTVTQFKRLYRETFPNGNPDHFAEHVFKTFDTNNSGYIDFRQFLTTLSAQLKGSFEDKLKWLFGLYDADATGYISKEDLSNMITVSNIIIASCYSVPDQISSNVISFCTYLI